MTTTDKHSTDNAIEARIGAVAAELRSSERFPSLSSFEHRAFDHRFGQGFHDHVDGRRRKSDWTGALEQSPDARFNQDSYDAGYDAAAQDSISPS